MNRLFALCAIYIGLFFAAPSCLIGQVVDPDPTPDLALLDFERDIKPIIEKKCQQCHNDDVTEGELNFDEMGNIDEFIVAGKAAESDFYQRLITDDEDDQMPPPYDVEDGEVEALTPSEVVLIGAWINQGAKFEFVPVKAQTEREHLAMRIWRFFGSFHPALTHFPVALFTIAAVFVVLFYRNPVISNEAAFYCLIFGTMGAVVACVLGWALAYQESSDPVFDMNSEMFWHRWSGIIVAVVGIFVSWLGWRQRSDEYADGGGSWKFGVLILAAIVGLVGFQGGELVYGEGHYIKQLHRYWPEAADQIFPEESGLTKSDDTTEPEKSGDEIKEKPLEITEAKPSPNEDVEKAGDPSSAEDPAAKTGEDPVSKEPSPAVTSESEAQSDDDSSAETPANSPGTTE